MYVCRVQSRVRRYIDLMDGRDRANVLTASLVVVAHSSTKIRSLVGKSAFFLLVLFFARGALPKLLDAMRQT